MNNELIQRIKKDMPNVKFLTTTIGGFNIMRMEEVTNDVIVFISELNGEQTRVVIPANILVTYTTKCLIELPKK